MTTQQRGAYLCNLIQVGDFVETVSGRIAPVRRPMTVRHSLTGYHDYIVSIWVQCSIGLIAVPVSHDGIIAVWRDGVELYREGETAIQMTMFDEMTA